MAIYELHELDPDKLVTGELDPNKIEPIKFQPFEKNSKGMTIIDKNKDLTNSKNFISLYASKPSQQKFNQVVDIEFADFVEKETNPLSFVQNKMTALESTKSQLQASKNSDASKIAQLQEQIKNLEELLVSVGDAQSPNEVPDSLFSGAYLWADRTGDVGAPAYPRIENKLLSKNRRAVAVIQSDGNFVIRKGDDESAASYDTKGNLLEGKTETVLFAKGWNTSPGVAGVWIYTPENSDQGQLEIVRGIWEPTQQWNVIWGSGRQKLSKASKIVLEDNGYLMLYDGTTVKWSSFAQ